MLGRKEGLSEGKEYNVFQTVKLTCEGTAPRLTASLNTSACDSFVKRYVTFHISPEQFLNNGDKVIVTADWSRSEAAKNLYLITKEKQEYTVSNQPTYLTTLREEKLPGLTFLFSCSCIPCSHASAFSVYLRQNCQEWML